MKCVYLLCSYATIYLIYAKFKPTYNQENDKFRIEFVLVPAAGLAFLVNHHFEAIEILWTFSIYRGVQEKDKNTKKKVFFLPKKLSFSSFWVFQSYFSSFWVFQSHFSSFFSWTSFPIWKPSLSCPNFKWSPTPAKLKVSPVTTYSSWDPTELFTSSTGSGGSTTKDSMTISLLWPDAYKLFCTSTSFTFTSPKYWLDKNWVYRPLRTLRLENEVRLFVCLFDGQNLEINGNLWRCLGKFG